MNECDVCKKDLDKEFHDQNCPYVGIGNNELAAKVLYGFGWECPKCKRIYSPHTSECIKCNEGKGNND